MTSQTLLRCAVVAVASIIMLAPPALAGPPTDHLKAYTEQVMKILEDPAMRGEDKRDERRAAVRRVAVEVFDLNETARRALGRHWQGRTPEQRKEFVDLFADLLERTYLARIDMYGGENVRYVSESVDGNTAIVRARVITRKGTEVPVEARMHRPQDRWLMYDVLLENVSLVGNYRAQFDQIIRTSSYDELVRRLREKKLDGVAEATTPRGSSR